MQKTMKLCDCPVDVCRADQPPEHCRFVMDPHDKTRVLIKEWNERINEKKRRENPSTKSCEWCSGAGVVVTQASDVIEKLESDLTAANAKLERYRIALEQLSPICAIARRALGDK